MNNANARIRELSQDEVDLVSGGLKWTPGMKNDHVIDRRGATKEVGPFTIVEGSDGRILSATFNPPK